MEAINALKTAVAENANLLVAAQGRLDALEKPMEQQVEQAVQDLPRQTLRVGYRPTKTVAQPVELTAAEIAAETLNKIPRKGR